MDRETKLFLGKILGEVYRLQRAAGSEVCKVDDATIYGLLHGFEEAVDDEFESVSNGPTRAQVGGVIEVFTPYNEDRKPLKGYYDIERQLKQLGISRWTAIQILTMLNAKGAFQEQIAQMDSSQSPEECRRFTFEI